MAILPKMMKRESNRDAIFVEIMSHSIEQHDGLGAWQTEQEAQLMLTTHAMRSTMFSGHSSFVTSFAIIKKLIACQALLRSVRAGKRFLPVRRIA